MSPARSRPAGEMLTLDPVVAEVKFAWDADNLYLHYEGEDDRAPFANAATAGTWMEAFKHGDTVDLMLATDPSLPADRRAPGAGDLRLSGRFAPLDRKDMVARPATGSEKAIADSHWFP